MILIDKENSKMEALANIFKKKEYELGLTLSGGGVRGIAHAGILKYFDEVGITPNVISGVSAGGIVGALYADGYKPEEIKEIFKQIGFRNFTTIQRPKKGLFSLNKFENFLKGIFRAKYFEDLKIPLRIVATDFDRGKVKVFQSGKLLETLIASSSVPVLFSPKNINGTNYVDGGVLKNIPASVLRDECEKLISVNVSPRSPKQNINSILEIGIRTYYYMHIGNNMYDKEISDLVIEPSALEGFDMLKTDKIDEIFTIGYNEAKRVISTLSKKE